MKHLNITYGDIQLFSADVEEVVFTDNDQGATVEARIKRVPVGGGLLDLLASAAKPKPKEDTDG